MRLTLLGGFLGSGKTTWLRHQLHAGVFSGAHVIVHSIWTIAPGRMAAQARGIPSISASMFPLFAPTAAFPAVPFSALALGPRGSTWTHATLQQAYWQGSRLIWGLARRAVPRQMVGVKKI